MIELVYNSSAPPSEDLHSSSGSVKYIIYETLLVPITLKIQINNEEGKKG